MSGGAALLRGVHALVAPVAREGSVLLSTCVQIISSCQLESASPAMKHLRRQSNADSASHVSPAVPASPSPPSRPAAAPTAPHLASSRCTSSRRQRHLDLLLRPTPSHLISPTLTSPHLASPSAPASHPPPGCDRCAGSSLTRAGVPGSRHRVCSCQLSQAHLPTHPADAARFRTAPHIPPAAAAFPAARNRHAPCLPSSTPPSCWLQWSLRTGATLRTLCAAWTARTAGASSLHVPPAPRPAAAAAG